MPTILGEQDQTYFQLNHHFDASLVSMFPLRIACTVKIWRTLQQQSVPFPIQNKKEPRLPMDTDNIKRRWEAISGGVHRMMVDHMMMMIVKNNEGKLVQNQKYVEDQHWFLPPLPCSNVTENTNLRIIKGKKRNAKKIQSQPNSISVSKLYQTSSSITLSHYLSYSVHKNIHWVEMFVRISSSRFGGIFF